MANQSVASGILTDYNGNPFLPRTTFSQVFKDDDGTSLNNVVWPVPNGGTGKKSHTANSVLVGNGSSTIKNIASANGAFYATSANGEPKFGTLPVAQGGTGITSNPSMLVNLGSTTADTVFEAAPRPGITGTLGIGNGGTGATTAANALKNLGLTATATELNYVDGVTSNIQTQLNGKSASDHNHDSRYYTETEIGTIPSGYSSVIEYINSKTSGTATSGNLAALATRVGDLEGKSLLVDLGSTSAVALSNVNQNIGIKGTLPVSKGGTGATSATANRILYFTNNALTASSHYMNASKLAINSTAAPSYNLYVNGSTCLNGRMVLRNSIYGSLDDMNAITTPEEGQVFFVIG